MQRLIVTAQGTVETVLRQRFPRLPESALRKILSRRDVKRGGVRLGARDEVAPGDELNVYLDERLLIQPPPPTVYESAGLLVVEKPPGLSVDATGRDEPTVLSLLSLNYPGIALCHRLDHYTGGLLVLAKDGPTRVEMERAFKDRTLEKYYECLVRGTPTSKQGTLQAWLKKDAQKARVTILSHPAQGAPPIETGYRVLESRRGLSRLEVSLLTGRTHQIRAHLAYAGCPVLGDDRYGDRDLNRRWHARYQQLWACRLVFHFDKGSPLAGLSGMTLRSEPRWDVRW